ncbi:hypothetical protein AB0E01_40345 [Nocardia vinacea]
MATDMFAGPGDRWEEYRMSHRRLVLEISTPHVIRKRALGGGL